MLVDCQQRDGLSHERQSMAVGAETARSELEELKIEVDRAKTQMTGLNRWEEACSAALLYPQERGGGVGGDDPN